MKGGRLVSINCLVKDKYLGYMILMHQRHKQIRKLWKFNINNICPAVCDNVKTNHGTDMKWIFYIVCYSSGAGMAQWNSSSLSQAGGHFELLQENVE